MQIMTADEVRKEMRLLVSRAWVYEHWRELGGTKIGQRIFFTKEGLQSALQRQGEMEGSRPRGRKAAVGQLRDKTRGQGVGGGSKEGIDYLKTFGII